MAGIKGRSGRKSNYKLLHEGNLLEVCTKWLCENFVTFDKETKIRVALEIAKKGIIQKHEVKVDGALAEKIEESRRRILQPTSSDN